MRFVKAIVAVARLVGEVADIRAKQFVALAVVMLMATSAPVWADTAQVESTTEDSETAALRAEVQELKERLARLEVVLTRVADAAEQTREVSAAAPLGDARWTNANLTAAAPAAAATPPPVPVPQDDDEMKLPTGVTSTGGQPLMLTGLIDAYYSNNFNNPENGTNDLYYTNPNSRGFGLNQAKLEVDAFGDGPVGVRADIWFGSGARGFRDGLEPGPLEDVLYLQQAYGYYQFENGSQLDFGLFNTIAGLEVAESHLNWNYSRGLLWAWNEPFSHLGAKYSAPISDTFTGTVMLVNGFDNAFDQNSGKSYGVQGSWAPNDRFNTTLTWIHGPENFGTNMGYQKDVSWNMYAGLTEKFEVMVNFDGIWNENPDATKQRSWGLGGYARYSLAEKWKVAGRFEYFDDTQARSTGVEHILKETTLTLEYAPQPRFITRFEYRKDWSTTDFFNRGNAGGFSEKQDTLTLGMMYIFGPSE